MQKPQGFLDWTQQGPFKHGHQDTCDPYVEACTSTSYSISLWCVSLQGLSREVAEEFPHGSGTSLAPPLALGPSLARSSPRSGHHYLSPQSVHVGFLCTILDLSGLCSLLGRLGLLSTVRGRLIEKINPVTREKVLASFVDLGW